MSLSGYGEANNINTSQDVDTGLSVSGELSRYVNDNFGLGGGVSLQLSRKLSDADGEFNFIPFYGIAKLRTSPDGSGNYKYVLGQLGYNSFSGDSNYKGQGGKLTGGLYWGMGAGFVFKMIHVEALYSVNNGKYEQSTYVYDSDYYVYRYFSASGDVKYSSISLNIGVHF
jgi:hypothetical protein